MTAIYQEQPYKSQVNKFCIIDEDETLSTPLCKLVGEFPSCEMIGSKQLFVDRDQCYISIRATSGKSAAFLFRQGLEALESITNDLLKSLE